MSTLVATTSLYAVEKPLAETSSVNASQLSRAQFITSELANTNTEWMSQSIVTIMQLIAEIANKCAGAMRDETIASEVYTSQFFIDQTAVALNEKYDGLDHTKDASQSASLTKMGVGLVSFLGLATLWRWKGSEVAEAIGRITSHNSIAEALPEYIYNPDRTKGTQESEMADNRSVLNNVIRETRDRLADLKGQMSTLIAKICTTLEEVLRSLSAVYKVPFSV